MGYGDEERIQSRAIIRWYDWRTDSIGPLGVLGRCDLLVVRLTRTAGYEFAKGCMGNGQGRMALDSRRPMERRRRWQRRARLRWTVIAGKVMTLAASHCLSDGVNDGPMQRGRKESLLGRGARLFFLRSVVLIACICLHALTTDGPACDPPPP